MERNMRLIVVPSVLAAKNSIGLLGKIAAFAVIGTFFSFAALADEFICERQGDHDCACAAREAAELLPPLPTGCHKERITAAGEQTLGIVRSAEHLGRKAWQRQVVDKYGERFQQWENAACRAIECVPGSLAGSRRCTYSAYACSPEVDTRVLADLRRDRGAGPAPADFYDRSASDDRGRRELRSEEIAELQRLLRQAGYDVSVDGQFGEQTSEALIKWQRRTGSSGDGEATFRNLELLRHASR
jgi:Putative peptidoglycan binding domain